MYLAIRGQYWKIRWAYQKVDEVGRSAAPLATEGTQERSMASFPTIIEQVGYDW